MTEVKRDIKNTITQAGSLFVKLCHLLKKYLIIIIIIIMMMMIIIKTLFILVKRLQWFEIFDEEWLFTFEP
jgi:hypothetical protein